MVARSGAVKRRTDNEEGIWLNRFWTVRRPSEAVLNRIAEELGDNLRFFEGDPRRVIGVVRVLTEGRSFKMSEHLRVNPSEIPELLERAKGLK